MNIAIFTDTYYPQVNGVVTSTITFAKSLEAMGHRVLIVGPKLPGGDVSTDSEWRLRSIPYPFQKEHRIISPFSRKLLKFKDQNIDVIHIQSPFLMGHLGQFLGWRHGIPVVHTYHTYWYEYLHYFPLLPERFRKGVDHFLFTRNFCNRCDHIVVPSGQMADKLLKDAVSSPLTVIPTGVSIPDKKDLSGPSFRRRYGIPDSVPLLIFVGRLGREKNVYFLLESFFKVQKKCPNAVLFIAGEGPEMSAMKDLVSRHELNDHVFMPGYLSHSDVFNAYDAADVIIFPSKTETQGLSLLEGLACGTPAVCIDAMGVKDILGNPANGGYLCPDNNDIFSEYVLKLLNDDALRCEMGEAARQQAQLFSTDAMAKRLIGVYERVI